MPATTTMNGPYRVDDFNHAVSFNECLDTTPSNQIGAVRSIAAIEDDATAIDGLALSSSSANLAGSS